MNTDPRISEGQLRALVRAAVARHLGAEPSVAPPRSAAIAPPAAGGMTVTVHVSAHPSHTRYALPSGSPELEGGEFGAREKPCLIEPSVRCNDCGYCQSHGH